MLIDSRTMVSITEVNQNFSRVAKMAEETGAIYVLKNNKPLLKISYIAQENEEVGDNEALELAAQLTQRSQKSYEVLAQ